MTLLARVPFLGTNDVECELLSWKFESGASARKGEPLCTLETTKTAIEVEAPADGLVYPLAAVGDRLQVGAPLALIASERLNDPNATLAAMQADEGRDSSGRDITKKAEILLARHGVNTEDIRRFAGNARVSEQTVNDFLATRATDDARHGFVPLERVGIIGGVSGGGALIVVDSLRRQASQTPVAIFDQDSRFHGRDVLGVPVVGSGDLALKWFNEKRIDAAVIAFNRDLGDRAKVFTELRSKGVRFCNVVDSSANLRSGVTLGAGNVILGQAYVGACSQIGDDNFLSGGVWIEHGNRIGSHCGFGPGVFTSGNVRIGDQVRFGTGIFVEPEISIGDRAVVASGSVLIADVPADSVVRIRYNQHVKPRSR